MIVPDGQIEVFQQLGWTLLDEPTAGLARMSPPVHRVPRNDNEPAMGRCQLIGARNALGNRPRDGGQSHR
jgi:hypothetical protein